MKKKTDAKKKSFIFPKKKSVFELFSNQNVNMIRNQHIRNDLLEYKIATTIDRKKFRMRHILCVLLLFNHTSIFEAKKKSNVRFIVVDHES